MIDIFIKYITTIYFFNYFRCEAAIFNDLLS